MTERLLTHEQWKRLDHATRVAWRENRQTLEDSLTELEYTPLPVPPGG